jgi:transcription factor TGA
MFVVLQFCYLVQQAYIQQLETSRMKLSQLELELQRARQQVGVHGRVSLFYWLN